MWPTMKVVTGTNAIGSLDSCRAVYKLTTLPTNRHPHLQKAPKLDTYNKIEYQVWQCHHVKKKRQKTVCQGLRDIGIAPSPHRPLQ